MHQCVAAGERNPYSPWQHDYKDQSLWRCVVWTLMACFLCMGWAKTLSCPVVRWAAGIQSKMLSRSSKRGRAGGAYVWQIHSEAAMPCSYSHTTWPRGDWAVSLYIYIYLIIVRDGSLYDLYTRLMQVYKDVFDLSMCDFKSKNPQNLPWLKGIGL